MQVGPDCGSGGSGRPDVRTTRLREARSERTQPARYCEYSRSRLIRTCVFQLILVAIPENRGFQKNRNSVFSPENNSSNQFWQKVSHSIGDHKYVKTCRQCMSLIEKTEFHFFFMSLFSGIAILSSCALFLFQNAEFFALCSEPVGIWRCHKLCIVGQMLPKQVF